MKKKLIIFGNHDTAELAHYYFKNDSDYVVEAFTADDKYVNKDTFDSLPLIPFSMISKEYPPSKFHFFVALTARNMNKNREQKYQKAKNLGYKVVSYISSKATYWPGTNFGENCFILEDNTIQPFVKLGNNITLWSGNHIGHHSIIDDHVFFTSHVVLSGHCKVESYSYFGVNSTIRDATKIAKGSFIAMGANVVKNTEKWSVNIGNPSKKIAKKSFDLY